VTAVADSVVLGRSLQWFRPTVRAAQLALYECKHIREHISCERRILEATPAASAPAEAVPAAAAVAAASPAAAALPLLPPPLSAQRTLSSVTKFRRCETDAASLKLPVTHGEQANITAVVAYI
jgi:hypothetical protein